MRKSRIIQIIKESKNPEEAVDKIITEAKQKNPLDSRMCKYPCTGCSQEKGCLRMKDCKRYKIWLRTKWAEVTKEFKK